MFRASVITLYPEMFPGGLGLSLAGNALSRGDWELETIPLREFGEGKHRRVDDTPAGGGAGMVLRADILASAIDSIGEDNRPRLLMSPRGKPLTQSRVRELAAGEGAVIVCGRFEGVDQRVIEARNLEEVSIGDYILSGGEPAALVLLDSIVRLLPGVMGNESSGTQESFENNLLEHPQFTRPQEWEGQSIPAVLTGGNHKKIAEWQLAESEKLTAERRPDLVSETNGLTDSEQAALIDLEEKLWIAEYRYDDRFMDDILAQDFIEFGKSGSTYTREDMFFGGYSGQKIDCVLPLGDIKIRQLENGAFLVTYLSVQKTDGLEVSANRSSIWNKDAVVGWQLIFHQGTAIRFEPVNTEEHVDQPTEFSGAGTPRAIMPAIPVNDLDEGVAFYRDKLGFQCVYQDPGGYAVLTWGSVELHLWLANDESWKTRKSGKPIDSGAESFLAGTHSCRILVKGVSHLFEKLRPLEIIHPNAKLEKKPWGSTEFGILDPYGNLVIFHEWI